MKVTFYLDTMSVKDNIETGDINNWITYLQDNFNVQYCNLLSKDTANDYLIKLENEISYLNNVIVTVHHKKFPIARKIAAYGDEDTSYTFSDFTLNAKPWTETLLEIKHCIEKATNKIFNFVLVTRYDNGNVKLGKHQDNKQNLVPESSIAVLSLGEKRRFQFSRQDFPKLNIEVENGSLLIINYPTNEYWFHSVPKSKETNNSRISLTFRLVKSGR